MTKQKISDIYLIDDNGVITSPGKFEGEMYYAVHYWGIALDGFADRHELYDNGYMIAIFDLGEIDYDDYPELEGMTELRVWEDDNGFVYCRVK